MFRKILFISLALLLSSSAVKFALFNQPVLAAPIAVDRRTREQILGATVFISMFVPLTDAQGNPQYVRVDGQRAIQLTVGEGLGTMVRHGEEVVIVTHDHWPLPASERLDGSTGSPTPELVEGRRTLRRVEFRNVDHELLLEMSGEQFLQLIRYRDGGTMVLSAPDVLAGRLSAVPLGGSDSAGKNDMVTLAHRQSHSGQIGVAKMRVQKEITYKGQPVYRLTSLNGEVVIEGNSGGGVLFDGQLIGNMWGTIMVEEVSRVSGSGAGSPQQTSFSLAAQLPEAVVGQ